MMEGLRPLYLETTMNSDEFNAGLQAAANAMLKQAALFREMAGPIHGNHVASPASFSKTSLHSKTYVKYMLQARTLEKQAEYTLRIKIPPSNPE